MIKFKMTFFKQEDKMQFEKLIQNTLALTPDWLLAAPFLFCVFVFFIGGIVLNFFVANDFFENRVSKKPFHDKPGNIAFYVIFFSVATLMVLMAIWFFHVVDILDYKFFLIPYLAYLIYLVYLALLKQGAKNKFR